MKYRRTSNNSAQQTHVLNAVNETMGRELFQALKIAAQNNHVRCLIITGNGRAFSAGEDIQDLRGQYERGETPDYDNVFSTNTTRLFGEFVKLQNQSSPR